MWIAALLAFLVALSSKALDVENQEQMLRWWRYCEEQRNAKWACSKAAVSKAKENSQLLNYKHDSVYAGSYDLIMFIDGIYYF